ncbi:MAG: N-acetylneuraminate synthase [Methanomicrobiales archaeon]|nr:N-acetylneuraminate synthase [Methanomicrobiales archaeon]
MQHREKGRKASRNRQIPGGEAGQETGGDGFLIGGRSIGRGASCFIIAEAGVNHNGDLPRARQLVDAAAASGADAVKFQSFVPSEIASPDAEPARYQKAAPGGSRTQRSLLERLELAPEAFEGLARYAKERGILFLSSPFDHRSADLLESLDVPAFKIASGEITNLPFLRYVAGKGRPIILSTGMATLGEIEEAVQVISDEGVAEILLLHCVTSYPAPLEAMNLRVIRTLRRAFQLPVGLSDHTLGYIASAVAVALGACAIEKHLTLSRSLPGPDHRASAEPAEMAELVRTVRSVELALGTGVRKPTAEEREIRRVVRRSLVAAVDIPRGSVLAESMVTAKRPGTGLPPRFMNFFIGRRAREHIPADTQLSWDLVE